MPNPLEELVAALGAAGNIRYGMPTEEKEALALKRALPSAPPVDTTDAAEAQRYAAGYLHTQHAPQVSQATVPAAMFLHALLGESPELNSYAQFGANNARLQRPASPLVTAMMQFPQFSPVQ